MTLNLSEILLVLLIFQLLFVSFFLFTLKSYRSINNNILGLLFLLIALSLIDNFCLKTGIGYYYPNVVLWSSCFPLLYGPLLYNYTQSLLYNNFKVSQGQLLHLLPFVVLQGISYTGYLIQPDSVKSGLLHAINSHYMSASQYIISIAIFIHFLAYINGAFKTIRQYKAAALNQFSDWHQLNLHWLSSMLIFFIILFVLSVVNNLFEACLQRPFYNITLILVIVALLLFINSILFKALRKPEIFKGINRQDLATHPRIDPPIVDRSAELEILNNYMQTQKPYLNAGLTVETLAKAIRMRPKELSVMINENLGQNFFDYINRYRIEEARCLLTNQDLTVLEVLYRVGFNSKSSFNVLFKKYTGLTPTEFRSQKQ